MSPYPPDSLGYHHSRIGQPDEIFTQLIYIHNFSKEHESRLLDQVSTATSLFSKALAHPDAAVSIHHHQEPQCPSCGAQVWREGKEGEHLLCGSLNSCGWSVDANARDLLLSSLVSRLSFTCPKGYTGALALTYTSTEDHLVAVCLNTDLRFKVAYNSQSPDYVAGSGGRCTARCTISWQDLRPKERARILTEIHHWQDGEEDNPDTVTPDSAFSTGKTQNFYTKVSSQDYSRNYLGLLLEILLDIFPNIPLDF